MPDMPPEEHSKDHLFVNMYDSYIPSKDKRVLQRISERNLWGKKARCRPDLAAVTVLG